ncbi:flavodoxin family protein [bacterium]|nr:flavodoxin family protein [bacterium]
MKVIAINCSPRQKGSTATLLHHLEKRLTEKGHDVEFVPLYDLQFKGCKACQACQKKGAPICAIKDELIPVLEAMEQADAIILGSPVYIGLVTGCAKSLIERCYTFYSEGRSKIIKQKIFTDVVTQGGDIQYFKYVREHLYTWFIESFEMQSGGSLVAAGVSSAKELNDQPEIFDKADIVADNIDKQYKKMANNKSG